MNALQPEEDIAQGLPPDELWALVERVAASNTLRRSARMRELLLYVGRQALFENYRGLHEAEIGIEVFHRSADYDTSQDNIVRVNFSELRKRIDQFFASEGAAERYGFEVPRGAYIPRFFKRDVDGFDGVLAEQPQDPPPLPPDAQPTPELGDPPPPPQDAPPLIDADRLAPALTTRSSILLSVFAAITTISLATSIALWSHNRALQQRLTPWKAQPGLRLFWGSFFDQPEPVDIIAGDSSVALAQDIARKQISLSDYISYNFSDLAAPANSSDPALAQRERDIRMILSRNIGSTGDFLVSDDIQKLAEPNATRFYHAREYSPQAVRQHNTILVGSRRSNPFVELFEDQLEYRFSASEDRSQTFITVVHPRAGEQAQYASYSEPSTRVGYCVVALLPSPTGHRKALLIAGTDGQATEATGEFLTTESSLQPFLTAIHYSPSSELQVLLKTERVRGTPINATVVSYRIKP